MHSLILALFCSVSTINGDASNVGSAIDNFALVDHRGQSRSLARVSGKNGIVVAFLGTECPLAKLYGPRLAELAAEYGPHGVTFLGIDSNRQDSLEDIAHYVHQHKINFPVLKDHGNRIANQFRAQRTPEVFVLDVNHRIRYRGRIDDQFGVGYVREEATRHDLRNTLDAMLAGNEIKPSSTRAVGCIIGRVVESKENAEVTYSKQISRIFQKHCVECHRDGQIAPFSLTSYDEIAGWSETIAEVIRDQRMPPWHANPLYGSFSNQRLMTDQEKELVFRWVADGAPEGDYSELPEPREFVTGWRLPQEPDLVVPMSKRPFVVPPEGTVEYQYFVVDPKFKEDRWVSAAEVIPGNRSVVHHSIVFLRPPGNFQPNEIGWLSAYVPGQIATRLPTGQAIFVAAGTKFVFQMHYTPNGSVQNDVTKVGMVFADPATVTERILTMISLNREFEIPAHAANHRVTTTLKRFPRNARLLAMAPHMHVRGKSFRFILHDGKREQILLDVPQYDFNWQHTYRLANPLPLKDTMEIECVAHFDNSASNLVNPDPSKPVRWGDQTWEEMVVAYFGIAVPRGALDTINSGRDQSELTEQQRARATQIADRLISRFDKNDDGAIHREEAPETFMAFAFRRFDRNHDGRISRHEAEREAIRSVRNGD